jgi:hypothetical protein
LRLRKAGSTLTGVLKNVMTKNDEQAPSWTRGARRYWLCQIGGWGGVLVLTVLVAFISASGSPDEARRMQMDVMFTSITCIGGLLFTHGLRCVIRQQGWMRLSPRALWTRLLLALLAGTVVLCLLGSWALSSLAQNVTPPPLIASLMMNGLLLAMWMCVYVLYHIQEAWTLSRLRESQLRASGTEAQIAALQAQTSPHFLFNALNVIRALVPPDAKDARAAITSLATLLRSCLVESKKRGITLAEDLEIMRTYLEIEKLRFDTALRTQEDVSPAVLGFLVPPLMCLTLAENAIKHGLQHCREGGLLRLKAEVQGQDLVLGFSNPTADDGVNKSRSDSLGLGLSNLDERIRLTHPTGSSLSLELGAAAGETTITIRLQPSHFTSSHESTDRR